MNWDLVFFLNSILLGIGLAMDAFSVSVVNGLNEPKMKVRKGALMAATYAFFQFAMPVIGWICVKTIAQKFKQFELFIPWIALVLLAYIGGKMLVEGIRNHFSDEVNENSETLTVTTLLIQGIATSIDALSVGFTINHYPAIMAIVAALIIAVVTFLICVCGLRIGKFFGTKLLGKASILGGVILIGIGIEIFVKGIL